jgi:SNF2 family DNA or RNA helicase
MAQIPPKSSGTVEQKSSVRRLGLHINRGASAERFSFGTKVQRIMDTLTNIWQTQSGAKVLVFCQWELLRVTVQMALEHYRVDYVTLQGNEIERAYNIPRFAESAGTNVMLLSMEVSPSGLNLVMANHVILVQPTWHGEDHEKSVDYEEQAVGRCWRTGQGRTVHIWRLCTIGTVEEDMVQHHVQIWTDRQVRAGTTVLTVNHS